MLTTYLGPVYSPFVFGVFGKEEMKQPSRDHLSTYTYQSLGILDHARLQSRGVPQLGGDRTAKAQWQLPIDQWAKLNCDATYDTTTCTAGVTGVWRETNGRWLFGLCAGTTTPNVLWAELVAIKMGLEECTKRNMTRVIIHSDSRVAVDLINNDSTTNNSLCTLIVKCREVMMTLNEVKHCFREANKVADAIAKLALLGFCLHMDSHYLLRPPDVCFNLLEEDWKGATSPNTM